LGLQIDDDEMTKKFGVDVSRGNQFVVTTAFDDPSVPQDQDLIRPEDRASI
jgi:hypothetical protein